MILNGVRAFGMTDDLVAINSNFGDTAAIDRSCGSNNRAICQGYTGEPGPGRGSPRNNRKGGCLGSQGLANALPAKVAISLGRVFNRALFSLRRYSNLLLTYYDLLERSGY